MLATSGQAFGTMTNKASRKRNKSVEDFCYLANKDKRMRFNKFTRSDILRFLTVSKTDRSEY